jgi:hypothetical protein
MEDKDELKMENEKLLGVGRGIIGSKVLQSQSLIVLWSNSLLSYMRGVRRASHS